MSRSRANLNPRKNIPGGLRNTLSYGLAKVKSRKLNSPADVHTVFSIQTVKFCTLLLSAVAKSSPNVLLSIYFFWPGLLSVTIFGNFSGTFGPPWTKTFFGQKNNNKTNMEVRPRDGHVEQVCKMPSQKQRGNWDFCAKQQRVRNVISFI